MKRSSFFAALLFIGAGLSLLGVGCSLFSPSPERTMPAVSIPSGFPTDLLQFPYSTTTVAILGTDTAELVQITSSSTADVVVWFNQNYPKGTAGLHSFHEEDGIKVYSFQNDQWDYTVRIETLTDKITRISSKKVLVTTTST